MGPYKNLILWQKAMVLAKDVYDVTSRYPQSEVFGLVSQMRRCAVSIPSNIAEGYGRATNRDLLHLLHISLGSSNELETQLILSQQLSFLNEENAEMLLQLNAQINKMLSSLIYSRSGTPSGENDMSPQNLKP